MLKITGLMFLVYVINMQRYRPNPHRPEQVSKCLVAALNIPAKV